MRIFEQRQTFHFAFMNFTESPLMINKIHFLKTKCSMWNITPAKNSIAYDICPLIIRDMNKNSNQR